jgi:hypothetical protein
VGKNGGKQSTIATGVGAAGLAVLPGVAEWSDTARDAGNAMGETPLRSTARFLRTDIWETGGKRMKANGALLRLAWALDGQ